MAKQFNVAREVFESNDLKDLVELEHKVLSFWERMNLHQKLMTKNKGNPKFSFFDGPLTANNPLGVHHAWGRTYKDVVQRFKAMQGYDQRFQNGFDTQGLWVEVEVEKELGLGSKKEIEKYGLENFANASKDRVAKYSEMQTQQSVRLGQTMDWKNSYFTHTDENISAIWHFLKVCHDKGWLYKAKKPMPWCWRCGTSLSNHEQADSYMEVTHKSPFVKFQVKDENFSLLVWTTTPWTLPANTAVAVHPDLDYAKFLTPEGDLVVAGAWLKKSHLKDSKVVERFKGAVLERLEYDDPFPDLEVRPDVSHHVYLWEEVTEEEGSGMIHVAPGCGYDDYEFSVKYNLPTLTPLNEAGVYNSGYGKFSNSHYTNVNSLVLEDLDTRGLLLKSEEYTHRYPHCWRCKEELVFRLVEEWFISTDEVRGMMQDAAKAVEWKPRYVGKLFDDWLKNMGDWCISRKRYWGLPLPFYKCDCGHLNVVGSKQELQDRAVGNVNQLPELHRPWVDDVQVWCESCKMPTNRVTEVGDCWLDAGAMPFSTVKYFEDKDYWNDWFPADFVCEMREQTRLWFYATMFMSVTLEGKAPYKTVVSYEKVHDKNDKPMHKSTGNAVWFNDAVEKFGADTLRLMYLAQNQSNNMRFNLDEESKFTRPLFLMWNVLKFFTSMADLENYQYTSGSGVLTVTDRWVLSELDYTVAKVTELLENFEFMKLQKTVVKFMDDLSSWYVRRSRRRLWSEHNTEDKNAALDTLLEVLSTVSKLLAPLTPFMSEVVYQALRPYQSALAEESVHLCEYPKSKDRFDEQLRNEVSEVRQLVSMGLHLRSTSGLRVRQPLNKFLVWSNENELHNLLLTYQKDLQEELNVKTVLLVDDLTPYLYFTLKPNYAVLGPKYGDQVETLKEDLTNLPQEMVLQWVYQTNGKTLSVSNEVELSKDEVMVKTHTSPGYVSNSENGKLALLTTKVTKNLADEGFVRDFVRYVQTARKESDLNVNGKVELRLHAPNGVWDVLTKFQKYVWKETQTVTWTNLNSTYFDRNDPEVKVLKYRNEDKEVEVLFSLKLVEEPIEV